MISQSLRKTLERLSRNQSYRRRLPKSFGKRVIWVSPDARLRFLWPGKRAFDAELLGFTRRWIKSGATVLDIGANVGEFMLGAAHSAGPGGAALAIEADPYLASLLQRTIAESSNSDLQIETLCVAISGQRQISRFNVASRGRAANALSELGGTQMGGVRQSILVPTMTVDEVVEAWREPDFLKIDVEGGELAVLQGATNLLERRRPTILFECSKYADEIKELLDRMGYRIFDPADEDLDKPLSKCIFNTLAVHTSRIEDIRN